LISRSKLTPTCFPRRSATSWSCPRMSALLASVQEGCRLG
jgi:hypothetical protein